MSNRRGVPSDRHHPQGRRPRRCVSDGPRKKTRLFAHVEWTFREGIRLHYVEVVVATPRRWSRALETKGWNPSDWHAADVGPFLIALRWRS